MTKIPKQKPQYFNADAFVDALLKDLQMDHADPQTLEDLRTEISLTLAERVNAVVISSLDENDLFLLQKTLEDHPELDEIDCLSIITPNIPGLDARIIKAVDDLYAELLGRARLLGKQLQK